MASRRGWWVIGGLATLVLLAVSIRAAMIPTDLEVEADRLARVCTSAEAGRDRLVVVMADRDLDCFTALAPVLAGHGFLGPDRERAEAGETVERGGATLDATGVAGGRRWTLVLG